MVVPLVFITTYTIRAGKLEGFAEFLRRLFPIVEANDPGTLAINAYIDDGGTEVTIVQLHQDGASIKDYWRVVHQNTDQEFGDFVDGPTRTQVYGDPGDIALERTRHSSEGGAHQSVKRQHLGGFLRLTADPPKAAR